MATKPTVDFEASLSEGGMPVTEAQANAEFQAIVVANGAIITNTSKMSPFWRLVKAIVTAPVMWLKNILVTVVMPNMYLAYATGPFLELFAWALNLERKSATFSNGLITFRKSDPTVAITIPAGTIIQTERINGIIYRLLTLVETVIPSGTASLAILTQAEGAGSAYNLAAGYYRILPTDIAGITSVENEDDWLTVPGSDIESEEELRGRCRTQFNLVGSYHIDAVYRSMIATVAGLSADRVFFQHDAPRGPGTANAYLLLDTGVASDSFVAAVNYHITTQGYHGHGDDMQCFPMLESQHDLIVTVFPYATLALTDEETAELKNGVENLVRCAFRENATFDVTKTWPNSRFSFSQLGAELHAQFPAIESVTFSLADIISGLNIPRLNSLAVAVNDE
ncbi:baseplate J/gp47 family protein [Acerihabitans arboris]|uniref:Baseplate protein J-like barrel domain-containing protein n=1 Tax=Acerihabitans arboris TaxID=2691583 RepID=A0A845SQH6_9GAMM|nr:baseplate J/gp47 family protein [Acerihabitans arboris]NDL64838.1 hypothetical protein [Acerihabitans arboris]